MIPEVLLDTSFVVARSDARDVWHSRAVELTRDRLNGRCNELLTDIVVIESWGVLCRRAAQRKNPQSAVGSIELLVTSVENGEVETVGAELDQLVRRAILRARSRLQLSLMDAVLIEFMLANGISAIASFDAGFDGIEGIERIG